MNQYKTAIIIPILLFLALLLLDFGIWHIPFLQDDHPNFSPQLLFRSFVILLGSGVLIYAITSLSAQKSAPPYQLNLWNAWGKTRIKLGRVSVRFYSCQAVIFILLLCSCFFLMLFLHSPYSFSLLSYEDGWIEMASAILLGLGALLFLALFISSFINPSLVNPSIFIPMRQSPLFRVGSLGFAILFCLIALEEISWFQRIFQIPLFNNFAINSQRELNLHNYATDETELAYYFGSFIFLIVVPFYFSQNKPQPKFHQLNFFIPRRWLIFCAALFIPLNYDMWNNLLIQFSFFCTAWILLLECYQQSKRAIESELALIVLLTMIAQQLLYLTHGESFKRLWEITEYKEFFIALSLFLFSVDCVQKYREMSR